MRLLSCCLAAVATLALPLVAHADTFTGTAAFSDTSGINNSYNFTGTFAHPTFTFSGPVGTTYTDALTISSNNVNCTHNCSSPTDALSVTINFSSPNLASAGFSGTGDTYFTFYGLISNSEINWSNNSQTVLFKDGSSLLLTLPDFNFSDWGCDSDSENLTMKVLDPPTATPEPASLALLGTGVLGIAGVIRRRLAS